MEAMRTRAEKIQNGWHSYYSVSNSERMFCSEINCSRCNEKITGDYLIQDRQNIYLRGNESDERYVFHRKCSSDNPEWVRHDNEKEKSDAEALARQNQIKEVKSLIKKYQLEVEDLFEIDYY